MSGKYERRSLLVVGLLQPEEITQTSYSEKLPPHVTLLPWIEMFGTQTPRFLDTISRLAARTSPFTIKGGEEALFGPDHDILVRRLIANTALLKVHNDLVQLASTFGAQVRNQEWAGEGFAPHVTATEDFVLQEGKEIVIPALQTFSRIPSSPEKVLECVHPLSKEG